MPTRRAILLAAVSCIAACITTSHLANAGPGAADDASALAFLSATPRHSPSSPRYTIATRLAVRTGSESTAVAHYAAISSRVSPTG